LRLSKPRFLRTIFFSLLALAVTNLSAHGQAFAAYESLLWSFDDTYEVEPFGPDPGLPYAGLFMDASGNLYGTTAGGGAWGKGTAFELSPPSAAGGGWTESILWDFGNGTDGVGPYAGLIMDKSGNLYGTTWNGGTNGNGVGTGGTVFKLTPPSSSGGNWTESILWNFANGSDGNGTDGFEPYAGLIMDNGGNLYGTTKCGGTYGYSVPHCPGTVFELMPPATSGGNWSESILWSFNGSDGDYPLASLIMDKSGDLYGTTNGGGLYGEGTVFELTPPSTSGGDWTESVLWNFGNGTDGEYPLASLIMDTDGNLYGTTLVGGAHGNNGTVFELTPPSTSGEHWTESILWGFGNSSDGVHPYAGLIMDNSANLYGTTGGGGAWGNGTVFELTPPSTRGENWSESLLWNFANGSDGVHPYAGLIMDNSGNLYGTTSGGGTASPSGAGTVFEISPGGPATPTPIPAPTPTTALTASPGALNFGNLVATGTSKPKKVTLSNKGSAVAEIASITPTAPFTIAGGANTCSGNSIAPKKTCSFSVEFVPTTVSNFSGGAIHVTYNGTSPALSLAGDGIGVTLKAPKSASFPPVSAGSMGSPKNIVFSNSSTVTVTFGTAVLGGSDPVSFKLASNQCSGQALAPKGMCGIGVEFAPPGNASGTQSATLSLGCTYGANASNVSANLSGKVK